MANAKVEAVYQYIVYYKSKYDGNSPTIREIAKGCHIPSTSMVEIYLDCLLDDGRITMSWDTPTRKLMVKGGCWRLEQATHGEPVDHPREMIK